MVEAAICNPSPSPSSNSPDRATEFQQLYADAVAHAQANHESAGLAFARAAAFAPELWCDVATRLAREGEEAFALEHFRIALQITSHPGIRAGIFNNIAIIYARRGQLEEAWEMLDRALEDDPHSADALCNKGQVRKWMGNLEQSDRYCDHALAINPWHNEAQFLQALNALDRGDYARGFPLYECRWRSKTNGYRKMECHRPEWAGEEIAGSWPRPGRRLFVYGEQGAGDIFLMLRYAPLIRAAGMSQSWAVKPGMSSLLAGLVDHCIETGAPPDEFDCHIPSASLPYVFRTTIESIPRAPYLAVDDAVDYGHGFHVGIVWRGNKAQYSDQLRSTCLADWARVLAVPNVTFHSMQVDGAEEALLYPKLVLHEPPADWLETARRLNGLDLLISTDTGIVHLAGALGVRTWCALYCRPYFVFPLNRADSPWYPSVRLFKQKAAFEWKPVFDAIAADLSKLWGKF